MEDKKYCNQCENHCPEDALKCGRGRRAFGQGQCENDDGHSRGHGDYRHNKKSDGVLGLLQSCGHVLHHGEIGEDGLECLSNEEKEQLEKLLSKLLKNWNK